MLEQSIQKEKTLGVVKGRRVGKVKNEPSYQLGKVRRIKGETMTVLTRYGWQNTPQRRLYLVKRDRRRSVLQQAALLIGKMGVDTWN